MNIVDLSLPMCSLSFCAFHVSTLKSGVENRLHSASVFVFTLLFLYFDVALVWRMSVLPQTFLPLLPFSPCDNVTLFSFTLFVRSFMLVVLSRPAIVVRSWTLLAPASCLRYTKSSRGRTTSSLSEACRTDQLLVCSSTSWMTA